ncbi:RibD family protein [Streptosporangium longisporum]|uniref:Bacterial bifunctional deaminase-reductase C-terminal domain-containing protein n=1 Tax=Streptosporangium longisporum TaxID=46187 RepID=A0ABN3Y2T5_9ACTN
MDERPYVLLSCAMSVDGHIDDRTPRRLLLSNDEDFDRVDAVRATCDAILVGAETVRRDDPRLLVRSPERRRERVARGLPPSPAKVTLTATGDLDPSAAFFTAGDAPRIVYAASPAVAGLTGRLRDAVAGGSGGTGVSGPSGDAGASTGLSASKASRASKVSGASGAVGAPGAVGASEAFGAVGPPGAVGASGGLGAEVVDAGDPIALGRVLADLYGRGVRRLMVEGGTSVHTRFLREDLVDELHLAVAPFFVGDPGAPRFVGDGPFPRDGRRRMEVAEVRAMGDVTLIRYLLT